MTALAAHASAGGALSVAVGLCSGSVYVLSCDLAGGSGEMIVEPDGIAEPNMATVPGGAGGAGRTHP